MKPRTTHLRLSWPPTANHQYRHTRRGTYLTRQVADFRQETILLTMGATPHTGPVEVWISTHRPDNRRRDLDNLLKSLLDALTHANVWLDDSQVHRLTVDRGEPDASKAGFVDVSIRDIEPRPQHPHVTPQD